MPQIATAITFQQPVTGRHRSTVPTRTRGPIPACMGDTAVTTPNNNFANGVLTPNSTAAPSARKACFCSGRSIMAGGGRDARNAIIRDPYLEHLLSLLNFHQPGYHRNLG